MKTSPIVSAHRRIGTTVKKGVHVTGKTHQAVTCAVSTTVHPDYGFDRLQKLQDRQARRDKRARA